MGFFGGFCFFFYSDIKDCIGHISVFCDKNSRGTSKCKKTLRYSSCFCKGWKLLTLKEMSFDPTHQQWKAFLDQHRVTNRKNKIFLNGFSLRDALFHYLQWPTKSIPPCTWCSSGVYTHSSVSLQRCSCIEIYRSLRTIKASSGSFVLWQHSFLFSTPSLPFPTLALRVLWHSSCLLPPASLTGQLFTTVQLIRLLSFHYCFMWFICLKFFICWQKVWEMCPQWGFTSLIASWRSYKTGIIIHRSFAECFGQMCHIELFCSLINIWAWRKMLKPRQTVWM